MSEQSSEKAGKKSALRPAQVGATALASLTAAFLASTLGVYGTIAGAGIFSFMLTIGSELYLRSFERTKDAARRAKVTARARNGTSGLAGDGETADAGATATFRLPTGPTPAEDAPTGERLPPHEATGFTGTLDEPDPGSAGEEDEQDQQDEAAQEGTRRFSLRRVRWPLVIGTSFAVFLLVMLAITGFERITGNAVSGQGGTTIGTVIGGDDGDRPAPSPREDDSGEQDEQAPEPTSPEDTDAPEPTEGNESPPEEEQDEPEERDGEPVDEPDDGDLELPDDQGAPQHDESG
ncbi:hypothetical protein H0B56_19530 [Haloechinothrix sp. YIM 98757]|uniref:Uncharacterized protein n=1 Tax=Haloechinothrix aidingensis TaxID=2752311 RepID=A0A838AEP0_9PSEU|nr:hypothetical protein [Haloechinothrix aidingensis]MBA0127742.1 hypothetical protein [Haloechinothrix aidingensis]